MRTAKNKKSKGFYLPLVLVFAAATFVVVGAILTLSSSNYSVVKQKSDSNAALNVAEAGVNYYLWHLSHNNKDYCDGNACAGNGPYGPFVHNYFDASGNAAGSYAVTITPPTGNSSVVTVKSTGTSVNNQTRTVLATLGIPSFAQYSFITNSQVWFGDTESTNGPVHSNIGIHYDGTANGVVSAASQTYVPTTCLGGDGSTSHNGIWGTGGPTSYWNFPVPQVDFNQITSNMNLLQSQAQSNGIFLPTLINNKGKKTFSGYALQLNANGTVLVGDVTGGQDAGGINGGCAAHTSYTSLMQTVKWETTARALPANGIIFVADNAWIFGTVTAPLTIASGRLPQSAGTNTNVFLQDNITYTKLDGSIALGIISQGDLVVNSSSANNLTIDAFLLSQLGKVFRPYYPGNTKSTITIFGGIGSNSWWTWSWVNGSNQVVSGYQNTISTYDTYLALSPPPSFPQTGSFAILSWREEPIL